ncbi:helix-turn-helix domain-containing protein [Glaesserella parasuis]|uniref:Helix-turn-helix domain-containing protein n=1 Tax=Glaesserella parasuis TaxID=738 RepID=A0AAJ6ABL3_GLAPU|nr:helix-turn-helix domain-containing protein [Glaesserella parasuis]MDG6346377.1 helix-turn-helix domain-containing protein [Glaesserella parasuis]MDO9913980.1 helix-turn-helix domain-containing protein [Glaesserella parasuis]MDP0351277.1 helix-turn-helix domain-containing protein [Glaesserella parasuis]MDP0369244.1 helix-turn-helix domain-containing protein [Glaesserella parasuis]WGE09005.1 helix-turn-helix domain-containing protein [Glaesserella parasuis]
MPKKDEVKSTSKGRGRPTKYKSEYTTQVEKLCLLGATDKDIADFFDVDEATINRWKLEHSDFCESIKKGKMLADANVAERLYKRALGYEAPDIDIRVIENQIVETPLIKHYPPDPTSAIFWLKNRQPDKWRDKQIQEVSGTVTNQNINLSSDEFREIAKDLLSKV